MEWTEEEIKEVMVDENLIKVYTPGESLWAYKLEKNLCVLANEPLDGEYRYMDVVELRPNKDLGKVVFKLYPKQLRIIYYFEDEEKGPARFRNLVKAFTALGYNAPEGYLRGRCAVSLPEHADLTEIEQKLLELDDTKVLWEDENGESMMDNWFVLYARDRAC